MIGWGQKQLHSPSASRSLLPIVIGCKTLRTILTQSGVKPKPSHDLITRFFPRLVPHTLFHLNSHWFVALFTFVLIGRCSWLLFWLVTRHSTENCSVSVYIIAESAEKLTSELRELRVQHYTLKEQHDDLKEKMKFFTKVIFLGRFMLVSSLLYHCMPLVVFPLKKAFFSIEYVCTFSFFLISAHCQTI